MTLRARIAVFVAAAVGLTVGGVALASYRSTRDETLAEIDRFLEARAPLTPLVEDPEDVEHLPGSGPGGGRGSGRSGVIVADDVAAQIVFVTGRVTVLGSEDVVIPVTPLDVAVATGMAPEFVRTVAIDGVDFRLLTRRLGPSSALQVARDLTETEAILAGLRNRLVLIGLAGALLAGLAGWLLAGRAVRPVRALTAAAEHVAATGSLDSAIPVTRTDETGRLAAAFNEMLYRLETSRVAQQRLVADASHELRTPLTSLRTNIELLASGKVPETERAAVIADLQSEVVELGGLVGELVDLATVGRAEEEPVVADLAGLVTDVVDRAGRRSGIAFECRLEPVALAMRTGAVTRAISNLVDNALKWSPPQGIVTVTLDAAGLSVGDRGPGIPPDDLPFVFQRFYRAATARSLPGSGLGLAIVAAVAEDHGWTPFARNRDGGGAEVGWRLAA
jgi:two-component system sensor histidine kinase MprB